MGSQVRNTKALRETKTEIERLGGVYLGAEQLGKHVRVNFTINGTQQSELISMGTNRRYDAPNIRRKFRQLYKS